MYVIADNVKLTKGCGYLTHSKKTQKTHQRWLNDFSKSKSPFHWQGCVYLKESYRAEPYRTLFLNSSMFIME